MFIYLYLYFIYIVLGIVIIKNQFLGIRDIQVQ